MKHFHDLTNEEIADLTREEIDKHCLYECAQNGVKLIPEPVEPQKPDVQPDIEAYEVGDLIFIDRAMANKYCDTLTELPNHIYTDNYDYTVGYDYKYLKLLFNDEYQWKNKTQITPRKYYSKDLLDSVKSQLAEYKSLKEKYDSDKKEYLENQKERESTVEWILERWIDCREIKFKIQDYKDKFKQYLNIANNDFDVAKAFFLKAYAIDKDMEEKVFNDVPT